MIYEKKIHKLFSCHLVIKREFDNSKLGYKFVSFKYKLSLFYIQISIHITSRNKNLWKRLFSVELGRFFFQKN